MKRIASILFAGICFSLGGCASVGSQDAGEQARFTPRPPYLLNALADTADTIADHAPGPLAYPPRVHATLFRALTPGFWLDRGRAHIPEEVASQDAKFLSPPVANL